jgi:hypothetical protein
MKTSNKYFAILFVIIQLGCAPMTGYHPFSSKGGYSDSRITEDKFNVSFAGNAFIKPEKAKAYLLYRCAELAKENKFDYFIILNNKDNTTSYSVGGYSGLYGGGTMGGVVSSSEGQKPAFTVSIKCGKGEKPKDDNAYSVEEIIKYIGPQIIREDG